MREIADATRVEPNRELVGTDECGELWDGRRGGNGRNGSGRGTRVTGTDALSGGLEAGDCPLVTSY